MEDDLLYSMQRYYNAATLITGFPMTNRTFSPKYPDNMLFNIENLSSIEAIQSWIEFREMTQSERNALYSSCHRLYEEKNKLELVKKSNSGCCIQ